MLASARITVDVEVGLIMFGDAGLEDSVRFC